MPDYTTLPSDVNDDDFFDQRAQAYGDTLGRYLDTSVSPYSPMSPLPSYQDGPYVNPMDLPTESDQVPMYPQGPVMPSQSEPLGADVPPPQDFNGMNWSSDPSQGGLGLAASSPAMASPGGSPDWVNVLKGVGGTLEGLSAGYFGRTPMFMQQQRLDQQQQQLDQMNAYRREMLSGQLEARKEAKRMHDQKLFMTAMNSPRAMQMLETLGNDPNFSMAKQSQQARRVLKEADFNSLKAYKDFIPEEVQQKFLSGQLDDYELKAWVDEARVASQAEAKEKVKTASIQRAMNKQKNGQELTAYELQLVNERQDAEELKHADIDLKRAQAEKARKEAEHGKPDHSTLNRVHQFVSGGKSFEEGDKQSQGKALEEYGRLFPEGRRDVQMGTPAPVKERSNIIDRKEFLKTGKLVLPPRGITEGQLRGGDYTEITDKQKEAWGEVENSGQTLKSLFGMVEPLITAKTSAQAMKQYANLSVGAISKKNAAAATYAADSEAFSSRMARVFGSEVGVLTQGDVERWKRALPTFGDTVEIMKMKKQVFMDIYDQSRAMAMKKIGGEDISGDVVKLRATLDRVDKINPPSIDEDFDVLMGKKKPQ
jgi:hypothetical protein